MRFLWLFVTAAAVLLLASPAITAAGSGSDDEAARIAYLKKHVAPIRSLDPDDDDFSDLEHIGKTIGDARVVFLGEETHGGANTFRLRTRVIKYLHEKCDFDVLAFESGLYDCRKAWELLQEGKMPARDAVSQGVFGIWTGTEELQPMFRYLGKQATGRRPLEVCGFDCQFSGLASRTFLPNELAGMFKNLSSDVLTAQERETIVGAFKKLARPGTGIDKQENDALIACRKALADVKPSSAFPEAELVFWRQFLDSSIAMAEVEAATKEQIKTERNSINLRDAQMAKNLVWLAHDVYPKRKIIVWAAVFHLLRNAESIAMVVEPGKTPDERKTVRPYAEAKISPMGGQAWKEIGKEAYSIFFTAAEGETQALPQPKPTKLVPLIPGSIEDLLVKAGSENCFLNLRERGKEGSWLDEWLVARVLGDVDHEADWTKVCDGLIFIKKQVGVTAARMDTSAVPYIAVRDPAKLDLPYDRFTTRDEFGRTINFYLSRPAEGSGEKLPLAVFVQGPGCASVFSKRDGKIESGLHDLLAAAGKGKLRVLIVEKPGVAFGSLPKDPESAEEGSAEFRREHTLPRWAEAVNAAVRAAHRLEDVDWKRTVIVGYSEGGIVAAKVASMNPLISHVALLAGGGPTQLFDLIELAGQPRPSDRSSATAQARVDEVRRGWATVADDPDNADKLWLGQTRRRWSSFLSTSTLEGVLGSKAAVFAAQGTADQMVSITSLDLLRTELTARRRDLTVLRMDGRDHHFKKPDDAATDVHGFEEVFGKVVPWFQEKQAPIEKTIQQELDRMQGSWRLVARNQEGEVDPLDVAATKLTVDVAGEGRTVRSGDVVYSRSYYRINPTANPPTMDVVLAQGAYRGQVLLGIYEFTGDRWRVCLAAPGRDRPRDFNPRPASGQTLQEFEKSPK